ncbi:neuraminidase-like domain-containing protein [Streptomyces phaeochromogenes]|uniref:Tc toxin subunit A-related protein n=1 Tax=Streptomyces phaeochromogenes TaxID=1923 RepID=UPI0033FFC7D6
MALIVIRLHPVEPIDGNDFKPYLDDLVIEAFDLSAQNAQLGVSLGTTTYAQPVPPPPPQQPTPWIPAPTTGIVQHFDPPDLNNPPTALAVATAVIVVNPPAGHPEHRESDLRLKITRGGKEILHGQLYYNVPVEPGGIPADRGTIPTLTTTSLYLALPNPGREIDPADGYVAVAADGTPPRYDQLRTAVDIVLGHDPGVGNPPQLADLTPRQARHIAYEIVWNYKYRPLPTPRKRTLAQMYTLPDQDTDGGDAAARGQFEGNLQAYYATGDADAERLSGFVLALAAGVYAAQRSAAADQVGFLMPVMPNENDTESRFKSVRVVLAGSEQPTVPPTALVTPFTVPAAYFYALGATIPPQINRDERYRLAVLAEEEHTRRALETAIATGVLLADAAGNVVIDGVNVPQAARRLRSLGAVQGVAPVFALNGPEPDRTAVRTLVSAWLAYAGDSIITFWRTILPPPPSPVTSEITGHLELILRALTDGHQPLITAIENLPATRVQDIHQLTVAQWRALFGDPVATSLLPRFTQPGGPADRVAAFIRHVQKFFAVETADADADAPAADAPPRLRTSAADPIAQFAQQYRLANGTEFMFGGVWDSNLVGQAVADVFPPDSEPDAHDWLVEAVEVIDELVRLSTSADIPVEARLSVMEALYARGFTDRGQVGRLTADELRAALVGTVAFEHADAIQQNGTGAPPVAEGPAGGFTPVNPDDCLVNCVPPEHLSPLGPVAYLHDLLQLTQSWTCAGPPAYDDKQPTLGRLIAGRRGPVGDLHVTAANLGIPLPVADLVDECLEAVAANPQHPVGVVYDTNEVEVAGHRLADHDAVVLFAAVPEHSTPAAPVAQPAGYPPLATDFSAPQLPYAQTLDVNRSYLRQLGSSRYDVMRRFHHDITEFVVAPDAEPAAFQRHLWRYPVRIDIAREYLGISAEEYQLLFGTEIGSDPDEDRLTLHELYGFPAAREGRGDWKEVVVRLPEFLRRTGLSYCEFLELWRSQFVTFTRADDLAGFPDCEPCHLDDILIAFPGQDVVTPLRQLAVFIRLWRRLRSVPGAGYDFAHLRDICVTLHLFNNDGTINPDFIRQLAAFQMLRDSFGIALVDPRDPPLAEAVDSDRTHLLALWIGPAAAKWPWALDELLDQVQVYAQVTHKCRRRAAEFRKLLADNLGALSALAGFDADGWRDRPAHTLRFAELLAKIYASDFSVGELIFMGTTEEHLGGDDPFPLQPDNEALGSPLGLPDDETEHSLAGLRRTLLAVQVTDEQTQHWTWRRIVRAMRARFGYAPPADTDPLLELAEHFFPSAVHRHSHHMPEERQQYRADLPGAAEAMWNTPDGPFRYDDTAQQLYVELPLTDEAVIAKLSRIRQLDAAEQAAVRQLYFLPRAALAPFAFLFADFADAQRRLIEEPDEHQRWDYFRHQFALCHQRSDLIAAHLAGHVGAVTGRDGTEGSDVAVAILRSLRGDENGAVAAWENDSGAPPAVTWPTPSGGAFAALLALTGTGLLGEFSTGAGPVWRELRGPTAAFGGAADAANVAIPTVVPALDLILAQGQLRFVRAANGMLFALPDGAALGGGQGFTATWSGVLLVDEGGAYEFHAGEPPGRDGDTPCWRVVLRRGQRYWVLLSRHWPDESAPARHSGPVSLRPGAYDLTIEFAQPEPAFEHADDVSPILGGFRLDYAGPDSDGERVAIPRERLFRSHVDATLADGVAGLDGAARAVLADRYTGSLRDIRRTYQRAFKAVLFAHRFALSAQPISDGGRSEIGYLLAHPAEFSGYSYPPDGAGYTVHRAHFDFDLQPVGDNYHRPTTAADLRADPTPRRQQALFDRWERIFDYTTVRRETAAAPEPPLWLLFHENAERHPDVAGPLRRHMGMDARHVPLVLAYAPGITVSDDELLDERWTTRVWYAERWLRALERAFPVDSIASARPDLWAADDPAAITVAEPVSGNANLMALVRNGFFEHGEPRQYAEITRLNDGLRARARAALVAYLCGMDRVALPWGGAVREPKHLGDLLLIDVAVADCQRASRIEDAISAVQTFVQRARLGLEPDFAVSSAFALLWDRRFADFEVWQAWQRRQVYRENWIDWEELARARRSEAFTFLEAELRRSTLTVPMAGGLEYWPAPAPPGHPGQLVLQARDPAQIQSIPAAHHGFGLLGTQERTGRPTWLSALTLPTHGDPDPDPDPDGGDGDGGVIALRQLQAVTADGRLPLWIQAAVDLGTTFLRVAAAGEPPASTAFAPQPAREPAPCCAECGTPHPAVLDEYYFWLIDFREYTPPRPTVNGVPAEQAQDARWLWHDPAELPKLLGWEPGAGVRLAWSRVHNGEFGELRTSAEGLQVEGEFPQLTLRGRTGDSLRFQVSGAVPLIGHRDPTAPGFRYDLATDSAAPLPTVIPVPGLTVLTADITVAETTITVEGATGFPDTVPYSLVIGFGEPDVETVVVTATVDETTLTVTRGANGTPATAHTASTTVRYMSPYPGLLPAYPYFVYFAPGAAVAPASPFAPALTAAAALRAHCQPEAALRWYELAFAPLTSDSSWLCCTPDPKGPEPENPEESIEDGRCCHDSTAAGDDALRKRSIILHYVDTLFELGDTKRARNTPEAWKQARLIYDTAMTLLGPVPRTVIATGADTEVRTVAAFEPHHAPLNPRLLGLYERGADRLARIHDCMPDRRVRPGSWFDDGAGLRPCVDEDACLPQSPYRFVVLNQKAMELAGEVRSLGAALVAAIEKGDAEYLQALRGDHELRLLQCATQVRQHQWREADWQVQALRKTKEITQTRYRYQTLLIQNGLSNREEEHVGLINEALGERTAGNISEGIAQLMGAIPDIFAGFPVTQTWIPLGTKLSGVFTAVARIANVLADISTTTAGLRLTKAGWERREEEWRHQVEILGLELEQVELQILAAERRRDIALRELNTQQRQVENSKEVQRFLRGKFTSQELYLFLQQESAALHRQLYELALRAARQAQRAFNYECGHTAATFVQQEAWDHLREGLLAGERLQLGLRQMEHAYLDANHREYELSKHLSLRLDFPLEFLRLQATGECEIDVPEWMFDADYAGHYLRRIKNVSLTIPSVVGPYAGVHCRLTLISSTTRVESHLTDPPHACCADGTAGNGYLPGPDDPRFVSQYAATEAISTSTGQNDTGLFELNFRDERRLPFEFAGAVSRWRIELPPENNRFDLDMVSDVVMHLNYTAREGGAGLRRAANEIAQRHLPGGGIRYFDVRHDMPDAWYRLRSDPEQGPPELAVLLGRAMFPFLPGRRPVSVPGTVVFVEADHSSGTHFRAEFEARPRHGDHQGGDCRPVPFECVASTDYPGLYWGVLDLDEPLEVTGEPREVGVFRFPVELRHVTRVLLFCRYQTEERHPDRAHRELSRALTSLRYEW